MLCIACGAEMRLMQAVPDTTMMVSGYEHHTWQCTGCDEVERRLVFTREKTPAANVPVQPAAAAPVHPTAPQDDRVTAPGVWARAVAKLRGHQDP
jgi:hypothetical protein